MTSSTLRYEFDRPLSTGEPGVCVSVRRGERVVGEAWVTEDGRLQVRIDDEETRTRVLPSAGPFSLVPG